MVPTAREASRPAPSVLVVDDDPATLVLLRKVLTQSGFAVDAAADGAKAIELTLTRRYDAVLLDLVMPQPDGNAVLRKIATAAPALLPKIIVITGYPQQLVAADTYALLSKPLDVTEVLRLVRKCVKKTA